MAPIIALLALDLLQEDCIYKLLISSTATELYRIS